MLTPKIIQYILNTTYSRASNINHGRTKPTLEEQVKIDKLVKFMDKLRG